MIKSKKNTVLKIAHIHVWDKKNKGDVAIVLAVQEILKRTFKNCQIIDFPVETLKDYQEQKINRINTCDLVVIGGGGIFYSYFMPFSKQVVDAIKIPIIIFGLGYIKEIGSPDWPKKNIDSVVRLVKRAQAVGVRDLNTKRFLSQHGVLGDKIKVVGDPVVFLSEIKPKLEVINKLKLETKRVKIGFNLNYSGWLGFGKWEDDILNAYRETIKYFQEQHNAQIYYIKHHPGEERIYRRLGVKGIIKIDLAPREQKYAYSQLDLIVGMMLHVGVMSFGARTPEISVAYDIRNYGFAEFIGFPELVIDLEKLKSGALLLRAQEVFKKQDKYQKLFTKKCSEITNIAEQFLEELKIS